MYVHMHTLHGTLGMAVASRGLPGLGAVPGSVLGSPQNKEQLCSPGLLHGIQLLFTLCSIENAHCSAF